MDSTKHDIFQFVFIDYIKFQKLTYDELKYAHYGI